MFVMFVLFNNIDEKDEFAAAADVVDWILSKH